MESHGEESVDGRGEQFVLLAGRDVPHEGRGYNNSLRVRMVCSRSDIPSGCIREGEPGSK